MLLAILGSLHFHIKFRISMSIYIFFLSLLGFHWEYTELIDQYGKNRHPSNTVLSNPQAWQLDPCIQIFVSAVFYRFQYRSLLILNLSLLSILYFFHATIIIAWISLLSVFGWFFNWFWNMIIYPVTLLKSPNNSSNTLYIRVLYIYNHIISEKEKKTTLLLCLQSFCLLILFLTLLH